MSSHPFAESVAPAAAMKKRANEKKEKKTKNPVTTLTSPANWAGIRAVYVK